MSGKIEATTYVYLTLAGSIKQNGDRHKANGDAYLAKGLLKHAAGSYRKAARNYERSFELDRPMFTGSFSCAIDKISERLQEEIAKAIINGDGNSGGSLQDVPTID